MSDQDWADKAASEIRKLMPQGCEPSEETIASLIRSAAPSRELVGACKEFISWYDEARRCERETGRNSMATTEAHTKEYEALEKVRSALSGVAKVECEWVEQDDLSFKTSCGVSEIVLEPKYYKYCPHCGLPIKLKENG